MRRTTLVIFAGALAASQIVAAQDNAIVRALQDEMTRSMAELRLPNEPAPYFIAYTVEDVTVDGIRATLGSIVRDSSLRVRMLSVDVRVGSYEFDNSRFIAFDDQAGLQSGFAAGFAGLPLDDDYDSMRRQIWIASDAAYKRAVNNLSRKKAAFQNRIEKEPIPDFSKEEPFQSARPAAPAAGGRAWADVVRQLSAVFLQSPEIASSAASWSAVRGTHYFINSEGTKVVDPVSLAMLRVGAEAQADDGMLVRDFIQDIGRSPSDIPETAALLARTRELADRVTALRTAATADDFTGPVLVEDQAARELVGQKLVPLFTVQRPPETGTNAPFMMPDGTVSPFLTRMGGRVLPESISVNDTPSMSRFGSSSLAGSYAVDEEGVPAKDVALVKNGMLAGLLTSRTPQKNFLKSNGRARGGSAQASVFDMQGANGVTRAELKQRYLDLLKQQGRASGFIVRRVANAAVVQFLYEGEGAFPVGMGAASRAAGPAIVAAVRVTPDGKEELVRGLAIGTITHTTFREILNVSSERSAYEFLARPAPAFGTPAISAALFVGGIPVTVIAPDLIFDELEIQPATDTRQKPPIAPSPLKPATPGRQ